VLFNIDILTVTLEMSVTCATVSLCLDILQSLALCNSLPVESAVHCTSVTTKSLLNSFVSTIVKICNYF